jgi:hypothetical protein
MRVRLALLAAGVMLLAVPASASAGRLIVTGHNADRTCAQSKQQCGFLKAAIKYVREAIRGTDWETDDRCDGTLVTVKTGTVSVFDQVLQKTVAVTAGHSYLAKAP